MITNIPATQFHEFHFVIGESMKENLENLTIYKEKGNISGIIVKILSLLKPVFEKEHKCRKQRNSQYRLVSQNPDEGREHIHTYLPAKMYRHLKLMHHDLNFYSIAQLIRYFLEFFLKLTKEYGDDVLQELGKVYKKWDDENMKNRLTPREVLRQLWIILQLLSGQNKLITVYDCYYTPFRIFKL
ncbi:MAG: hypothetical protein JXB88_04315 [Spirochaetales bacterium]|nr:hypothetical protein [Spirochaetales bacterium]